MSTVLDQLVRQAAPAVEAEQRILIPDVSWDFYLRFCEEIGERPLRLSYNDGDLEIMITKSPHEFYKKMLAKIVETIIMEREIPVRSGGSMTFQVEGLEKGFEPDECWWIEQEAAVRGKREFTFPGDPPPDLAIEIEISRSLVSRMEILAALGVREVWRYNVRRLRFCVLQPDGSYRDQDTSVAFPFLRPAEVERYLQIDDALDETSRLRDFRKWVRRALTNSEGIPPAVRTVPS
jgi:Uma2 family endonuclease